MKITVTLKSVYGVTRAYPGCPKAQSFADMLGVKTLTGAALHHIKALGFEIVTTGGATLADVA